MTTEKAELKFERALVRGEQSHDGPAWIFVGDKVLTGRLVMKFGSTEQAQIRDLREGEILKLRKHWHNWTARRIGGEIRIHSEDRTMAWWFPRTVFIGLMCEDLGDTYVGEVTGDKGHEPGVWTGQPKKEYAAPKPTGPRLSEDEMSAIEKSLGLGHY